jgi:NitT/TauT family transport system ATP-binding protein
MAVGDRIVVFGKSAALLADVRMSDWDRADYPLLREAIQNTLQANAPDARLRR